MICRIAKAVTPMLLALLKFELCSTAPAKVPRGFLR